jgi:DNA-binding NtrC family response regulator
MTLQNQFKIIVLEDNDFYNKMLTRQLQHYTGEMELDKGYKFDIQSYTSVSDCVRNLKPDVDIAIVDFYLGESKNALDVLKIIKQNCTNCKVIIISRSKEVENYYHPFTEGAYHFIYKDSEALINCCHIVEDIVNEQMRSILT